MRGCFPGELQSACPHVQTTEGWPAAVWHGNVVHPRRA